jgi:hypothetical protein
MYDPQIRQILEEKRRAHAKAQRSEGAKKERVCFLPLRLCILAPLRELLQIC